MNPHDQALITRYKVSELIKDAIIWQMALYICGSDFSFMNYGDRIFWPLV
jgi:hypothetical protein